MDKKITRRVVLGATVTALAVAPFVVRGLKKGTELPEGEFVKQWKKHQHLINDQKFEKDDSILGNNGWSFHTPPDGTVLGMSIMTTIGGDGSFRDIHETSNFPDVFSYTSGDVKIDSMKGDGQYPRGLIFQGNVSETTTYVRDREEPMKEGNPSTFSFLMEGDKRFPVSNGEVGKNELPFDTSGLAALSLPTDIPEGIKIQKGTVWKGGTWTNNYDIPLSFTVAGAGRLDGREALLIEGQSVLTSDAFQKHLQSKLLTETRKDVKSLWEAKLEMSRRDSRGISVFAKLWVCLEKCVFLRCEVANVLSVPEDFGFGAMLLVAKFDRL